MLQVVVCCSPNASGSSFKGFNSSPDGSRRSSDFLEAFLKLLVAVLKLMLSILMHFAVAVP